MICLCNYTLQHMADLRSTAICIQKLVSSLESASRDAYRTLLRPSSITEPRYPSLSVVGRQLGLQLDQL